MGETGIPNYFNSRKYIAQIALPNKNEDILLINYATHDNYKE
jgi:hypothetical protein